MVGFIFVESFRVNAYKFISRFGVSGMSTWANAGQHKKQRSSRVVYQTHYEIQTKPFGNVQYGKEILKKYASSRQRLKHGADGGPTRDNFYTLFGIVVYSQGIVYCVPKSFSKRAHIQVFQISALEGDARCYSKPEQYFSRPMAHAGQGA